MFVPPTAPGTVNWTPLGPAAINHGQAKSYPVVSGRITGLAVGPGGQRIYAGAANGGVWFSSDSGNTWTPLDQWAYMLGSPPQHFGADSLAVGAIAALFGTAADGSADTLFVGTGEPDTEGGYYGVGVNHFTPAGAAPTLEASNLAGHSIFRIVIDPAQPTTVFAATSVGLYQRPASAPYDRWSPVTVVTGHTVTPVSDFVLPAKGTKTFYAACPGYGIYSSANGTTWAAINAPADVFKTATRIALAASETDPPVIYALTNEDTLYRMDVPNGGQFLNVGGLPARTVLFGDADQGSYDLVVSVDPGDADTIYLGGATVSDGGVYSASLFKGKIAVVSGTPPTYTFPFKTENANNAPNDPTWIGRSVHADIHEVVFATNADKKTHDGTIVWVGTDGGPFASVTSGVLGSYIPRSTGLSITQLNYLAQRNDTDAVLYAGSQDNGLVRFWGEPAWFESPQGDAGGVAIDPNKPRQIMSQYVQGSLWAAQDGGLAPSSWSPASPPLFSITIPDPPGRDKVAKIESERTGFYAPIRAIANGTSTIAAFGTNRLWVTEDWGSTWKTLPTNSTPGSTDAVQDVLDDQFPTFRPVPGDSAHPTSYITAIWFATPALIYVATESKLRQFVKTGTAWSISEIEDSTNFLPINCIGAPADGSGDFYIGSGMWGPDSVQFHENPSAEFPSGRWKGTRFPLAVPVSCLVVDPADSQVIYVGCEVGVWRGKRSGGNFDAFAWRWTLFSNGLPESAVHDLIIHSGARLLRAATFGRGAWEIPLDATSASDPDIYVRTDYADSGRIKPTTNRRYLWIVGVPDPAQPDPATAVPSMSADIKVQRASSQSVTLPLDFPGYAILPYAANTMDALGANQVFVQVHNRSSVGTNPALDVNVLLLVADASNNIPQLPDGYASHIATPDPSPAWLGNSGWKFADTTKPFRKATIASSRLSAVAEYDVDLAKLGLGSATKLCAALLISAPGDILRSTVRSLDDLVMAEKRAAYRLFDVFGGWEQTSGPLGTARYFHAATRVGAQQENVIVAGGRLSPSGTPTNTVEFYDSTANSWTPASPMKNSRVGHTATRLLDGRALIAGGWNYDDPVPALSSAELYDPVLNSWTATLFPMGTPRSNHAAVRLSDGRVLVVGGMTIARAILNTAEVYDPGQNKWSGWPSMLCARAGLQAVLLKDGQRVLVVSWVSASGATTSEIYDPTTNSWGDLKTLNTPLDGGFTLTLLENGKVLRAGGASSNYLGSATAELFDPATKTWSPVQPMNVARLTPAAVEINSNVVLVSGGRSGGPPVQTIASAEVYDADKDAWYLVGAMSSAVYGHTLTQLSDGNALAAGGSVGGPNAVPFSQRFTL